MLGVALRIAGGASLLLLAAGVLMAAIGAWTLFQVQTQGDRTGWDSLIGGVALMLGMMMLVGGAVLAAGAHVAFTAWREQRAGPVGRVGWLFAVLGILATLPAAVAGTDTPLDGYMLIAGAAVALLGASMVIWARKRAPPA